MGANDEDDAQPLVVQDDVDGAIRATATKAELQRAGALQAPSKGVAGVGVVPEAEDFTQCAILIMPAVLHVLLRTVRELDVETITRRRD